MKLFSAYSIMMVLVAAMSIALSTVAVVEARCSRLGEPCQGTEDCCKTGMYLYCDKSLSTYRCNSAQQADVLYYDDATTEAPEKEED